MKLVRDNIPEIIESDGKWCLTRSVLHPEEHIDFLIQKMDEEVEEFVENPTYEEAADMLEVVFALCKLYNLDFEDALVARKDKAKKRGGFNNGIILQKVGKNEV